MVNRSVDVHLDEELTVSYRSGEESAIEVTVVHRNDPIVQYETNSRPWDEGVIQVRNVIASRIDAYSRAELLNLLNEAVSAHETELQTLFD